MEADVVQVRLWRRSPVATSVMVAIVALLVYALAFDQGALPGVLFGRLTAQGNPLHAFFHDGRHLLGFPCH